MNAEVARVLLEKLKSLPAARLAEVEDFIDFLTARDRTERDAAARRLGEAFARLDALEMPAPSPEEVRGEA